MSGPLSSTWSFVKRHKGKLFLLTAGVGGFVYLNKFLSSVERNWEKSASKDFVAEVRKKETHFENSIRTCNSTCTILAPKIVDILDKLLDCEVILAQLKSRPKDLELWKELSILIFTRAAVEVYSLCLFVCYLRVQLLVIAGYIYVDSCHRESAGIAPTLATPPTSSNGSSGISCNQNIQLKYLSLLNAFYDEGLKQLVTPVREVVTAALSDISLKDKLTTTDLKSIFDKIRTEMTTFFKGPNGGTARFLMTPDKIDSGSSSESGSPSSSSSHFESVDACGTSSSPLERDPDGVSLGRKEKKILKNLMAETQDLLETDDFSKVLDSSIDVGFEHLLDLLFSCFVSPPGKSSALDIPRADAHQETPTPDSGVSEEESSSSNSFNNPNTVKIPLAKLLPSMRNVLRSRSFEQLSTEDTLVRHLLCLDILNCYSANVYEAFCDPNNIRKQ